ncbi:peptidase M16 [Janibacter indicus]|uniref:Peptidase M16 n=1 Tax=Janibacter indicus TaxID=857417 RepID=A0A1L3MEH9_9MICO|nr:pitrilysin family protein [Janibacter indicus]APH00773.1 peptidase M16 [Janibacter indicus]
MPLDFTLEDHTLPNGLRVVVQPDDTTPTVTVNLWVGVGSRHEEPGRTGFAHLFEHLMFQGSAHVANGEHFQALMGVGGRLNATTWFDRTNYFETIPSGALELALWLEADRHANLLAAVNQTNLDNQRDVVKEEKRQRYDNQPYGQALTRVYATVFPQGHPYHHPTIGSMEDLDAASVQDVHDFFARHYAPDNTVLTIVGDVTAERALELAERYFGHITHRAEPRRAPVAPLPPLPEPLREEVVDEVPNDRIHLAFRLPAEGGDTRDEFLAASMALDCLGGLSFSPLEQHLVREEQVANSVDVGAMGFVDGVSLGLVVVDVAEGVDTDALEERVCAELSAFADEGPTPEQLEAVRAQAERAWLSALAAKDERADLIGHYTCLHDDPGFINTFLDRLAEVTPQQVQAAADRWLRPQSRAAVVYRAAQEQEEVA